MKVRELIKLLKDYEDFEVTTTISEQQYAGARPEYYTYAITGICDIAHSDKIVDLDNEFVK